MGDDTIEDDDLISQEDIDALLQSSQIGGNDPADDDDDEDISMLISQEDINAVLHSKNPVADAPLKSVTGDDDTIDESEAATVQDCLMTQDALDALIAAQVLQQTLPSGESDPGERVGSEVAELDFDMDQMESELDLTSDSGPLITIDLSETQPPFKPDLSDEADEGLVSQEDIDDLLSETGDESDEISSDDMDVLLDEAGDEKIPGDDDILISQDDIDALLTASDQEDEDILGDLLDSASESDLDGVDSEDDMDDDADDETESDPDHVILEGIDSKDMDADLSRSIKSNRWYRSKTVLAGIAGVLFLMILLPASYFIFVSPEPPDNRMVQPVARPEDKGRDVQVDSVEITVTEKPSDPTPGTLVLKDFLVLAPDDSKTLTYIAADIAIDYSDQNAYVEINDNLPFYRELIYESIQKNLNSDRREDITEPDLIEGVELALKKVLPENSINKIRFDTFKAG